MRRQNGEGENGEVCVELEEMKGGRRSLFLPKNKSI
jgi:hypothetical protein